MLPAARKFIPCWMADCTVMHDTNITWNDVVLKNYELYTNISKELEESECQWKWYLVTLMQEDTHNKTAWFFQHFWGLTHLPAVLFLVCSQLPAVLFLVCVFEIIELIPVKQSAPQTQAVLFLVFFWDHWTYTCETVSSTDPGRSVFGVFVCCCWDHWTYTCETVSWTIRCLEGESTALHQDWFFLK